MTDIFKEKNRFDLEQEINDCWNVVQDIKTIYSASDLRSLSEDEMANALLGLMTIYQLKFEKLDETFKKLIENGTIK